MGPLQEEGIFDRMGFSLVFDHRPIGQIADTGLMFCKTLRVKLPVKIIYLAATNEIPGIFPAAKETRPVARSEGCDFVKKEQ